MWQSKAGGIKTSVEGEIEITNTIFLASIYRRRYRIADFKNNFQKNDYEYLKKYIVNNMRGIFCAQLSVWLCMYLIAYSPHGHII